ncbi:MAG: glycoside hydrolase family 3 protein [Bacilli bacterium]|nr:glycoside hydrolase family 3 protein [Bacilli bacterium]
MFNGLRRLKYKIINTIVESVTQNSVAEIDDGIDTNEDFKKLCRKVAADSCVLLKNDSILPLSNENVALFGRCQINYFYVGYGSGGDVKAPYKVSLLQGLQNNGFNLNNEVVEMYEKWCKKNPPYDGYWGAWPMCYDEMPLKELDVERFAKTSEVAIYVVGRSSGEDRENKLDKGSLYLTKIEEKNLEIISKYFKKTVVLINAGCIIDMSFVEKYNIGSVMYVWQGGQESGNGIADVLNGTVNPSGKLSNTVAPIIDYPSTKNFGDKVFNNYEEDIYVGYRAFETFNSLKNKVIYPFGYGLSYTSFNFDNVKVSFDKEIEFNVEVKNTGKVAGRETVQLYLEAPNGKLGKPSRVLLAYKKTKLLDSNESELVTLKIKKEDLASFDDSGITGFKNSYVIEKGTYKFYLGNNVRSSKVIYERNLDFEVIKTVEEICPPEISFKRLVNKDGVMDYEDTPTRSINLKEKIINRLPKTYEYTGDLGYKLIDVKNGVVSLEQFVAQLNDDELETITRGGLEGMYSPRGAAGNAGVFGATSDSLISKGIPSVCTNDGPSGIRLQSHSTLLPIGIALACTFDDELVEELLFNLSKEMIERKSNVLLAPGMNIHRNPLCGRNFEYFSEDPYLTGKIGAAYIKGVQKTGIFATPKHFCCNNQETARLVHDSRVSCRALREIYWKGFEIALKEAKPQCLMMSYNKVNGVYSYYNYDLGTTLLRDEWNYEGVIMTDWWMRDGVSPDFENISNQAYRVRAQVDVFMPGSARVGKLKGKTDGSIINSLNKENGITRGELQRSAMNVLRTCLKLL